MKIFSLDKFIRDFIQHKATMDLIADCMDVWAVKCMGKTKEFMIEQGLIVNDKWFEEVAR